MDEHKCRHFNGTQHDVCEAGVAYKDVRYEPPQGMYKFPCISPEHRHLCPLFAHYTPEEITAFNAEIAAVIGKTNDFANGVSKACPECGAEVTSATIYEKIEPDTFSLYVNPCGHRLGLWSKVPTWITDVTRVPVED